MFLGIGGDVCACGSFSDKEALEPTFFARQAADQQEIFLLLVGPCAVLLPCGIDVLVHFDQAHDLQAEWLLAKLSDSEQQSHIMEAGGEVAEVLSKAQSACPDLSGLQAAELQPGFGPGVCTMLGALADKALQLHPPGKPDHTADRCAYGQGLQACLAKASAGMTPVPSVQQLGGSRGELCS